MKSTPKFAERLKQLRKEYGLTQAELAQRVSVTQQAVGLWESGRSIPHGGALRKIGMLFSVTLDDLLGIERCDYSTLKKRVDKLELQFKQLASKL